MMRTDSDDSGIPIGLACELAGISRQVRTTWIERSLVLGTTNGTCNRASTIDLACFVELVRVLGFDNARLTWPQVAPDVRERPDGRVDVVVDLELKAATLARTLEAIGVECSTGRPMKVVALQDRIEEVGGAYDRASKILTATERRREST
jgi:hypothetical protein